MELNWNSSHYFHYQINYMTNDVPNNVSSANPGKSLTREEEQCFCCKHKIPVSGSFPVSFLTCTKKTTENEG